jgi:ABC-type branched-subunit amino acid transport system ATPase component/ABC-type branched-subunit amino acid transport system permease subunit
MGLVLIYRSSRFINFAQGQMGSVASAALAIAVFRFHVPYGIAAVLALAFGVATGIGVERLLAWRLYRASRLTLLVATIGVAQLILIAVLVGPLKVDASRLAVDGYPQPFTVTWHLGSAVISSSVLLTLVIAPALAVALYLFLDRTRTGRAIRGAASNPDAARLAGISVRRVSLIVWALSGLVSSVAAILYAPSQPAVGFGDSGPGLLLRGLAAALLAGLVDFRVALAAGVAVGVVGQAAVFYTDVPGLTDVVVVVALAIGLLWRTRALIRDLPAESALAFERSRYRLPDAIRGAAIGRHAGKIGWTALIAVVAIAPLLPGLRSEERAVLLVFMLAFALVGMALSVLTGWAGQVSLGQFAFLGVGAYVATLVDGLGIPLMLVIAGLVTAGVSAAVGAVTVRFRGLLHGVITLAFAFAAQSWLFRQGIFTEDASAIVTVNRPHLFGLEIATARAVYAVGVVVLVLIAFALQSVRRSSVGRAIVASRDNPELAASYGLSPIAARFSAIAIAGFVSGVAGGIWAMGARSWTFSAFEPSMSFVLLAVAIVGGLSTLHGPVLGTIAVFAWPYLVPEANTLAIRSTTSGALLLITLMFIPGGLAGVTDTVRRRVLDRLASRRSSDASVPDADTAPALFEVTPAASVETPIAVHDVSVHFGGIRAVDGASVEVRAGEIVGLIGGNGAGKSTLLNVVSGHQTPDSGAIVVAGEDVRDATPERRRALGLARTFQDGRLFPGLTVLETVMAAMDHDEMSGVVGAMVASPWFRLSEQTKRLRAIALLDRFGLADRADSLTSELSTGMRRVCDLAAVVAANPSVVVLDEPTAGLAQREAEASLPLLRDLRDTYGAAVLIVEHDMPLMMDLCDRIYCLEAGRVIASGTPDEIRADPAVIASYLGVGAAVKP